MVAASRAYPEKVAPRKPQPDLWPVIDAARLEEMGEATIWRWLRAGILTRYKSKPGGPRRTLVDLHEVRQVKQRPPVDL